MAELTLFWSCSYCFCFQGYAEVTLAKMMDENQLGAIFILRKGKGVGGWVHSGLELWFREKEVTWHMTFTQS